jgi:nitrous oxide reductase accessory protein NosL
MDVGPTVTRREVTKSAAAVTVAALAGCTGEETPDPVDIESGDECDECGMVITDHPGPVGEAYFEENSPADGDEPAKFCSASCAYRYTIDRENEGWSTVAMFLTDYSSVDYEVSGSETKLISAHFEAAAFAATDALDVVVDSDVEGAMGSSLIPFSETDDAEAFADEYGGQRMAATDVTDETLAGIGR